MPWKLRAHRNNADSVLRVGGPISWSRARAACALTESATLACVIALTKHCSRAAAWSVGVVLLVGVAAALVRLLPWLLSPDVPLPVALPFAKALLAVAFEAAFFVGVPAGCALGA